MTCLHCAVRISKTKKVRKTNAIERAKEKEQVESDAKMHETYLIKKQIEAKKLASSMLVKEKDQLKLD